MGTFSFFSTDLFKNFKSIKEEILFINHRRIYVPDWCFTWLINILFICRVKKNQCNNYLLFTYIQKI